MKPKFLAFPLLALALSPAVMAGAFEWKGTNLDTDWTNTANWDITTSVPVTPPGGWTYPVYGTNFASDFLRVTNAANPGAVYDPGSALTTTFRSGRSIIIGSPADGSLTVSSGTLAAVNETAGAPTAPSTAGGNDALMANGYNAGLTINGGTMDLTGIKQSSGTLRPFHLLFNGGATAPGVSGVITVSSGLLSCNAINLQEAGAAGSGIINLEGSGILSVRGFVRNSAAGGTSTINFNGGTMRAVVANANFLPSTLANTTIVVKSGTTVVDTNGFGIAIAVPILHDPALGVTADGGFTKNGAGNLTLSGTNTFTGPVTVNAGTLATASRLLLASDSGAGTGEITLADSYADIQVNKDRNIANDITISNTGDEKTLLLPSPGGGAFASATFSGPITINETNIDHFRVRADDNCFLTLSGQISGLGGIFKFQNGTVTLSNAANDFTGGARITQGGLSFSNGALGTGGSILMDGGTLTWSAGNPQDISSRIKMVSGKTATLNLAEVTSPSYAISNVTFASAIGNDTIGNSTTAALVKIGPGTLTLMQASTYSGGTTVTQGILQFPSGGLGTTGPVTMNGGTLRWGPGNTEDISGRIVMVNAKTATFNITDGATTFGSAIGGATTAVLAKAGSGTLTLAQPNNYSGGTTVTAGTLEFANGGLGVAGSVTMNGGILRWTALNTEDISGRIVMVNGKGAGFSTNGNDVTFASAIGNSSTGSFTKTTTAGTLTLTGTNTYTGTTTVGGGTLKLGALASITTSASVTLGAGATLDTIDQTTYTIPGAQPLTFNIDPAGSGSSGKIAAAGLDISAAVVTLNPAATLDDPVYVLATYTSLTGAAFAAPLPTVPTGYELDYDFEGNKIALVAISGSPYDTWSGGALFGADANNDGVTNGLAFLLGAADVNANATGLLPAPTQSGGALTLTFSMRNLAARGTASLQVQHSSDLGISDAWSTPVTVPDSDGTDSGIVFDITAGDPLNGVTATIPASGNAAGGKLFGRVKGQP